MSLRVEHLAGDMVCVALLCSGLAVIGHGLHTGSNGIGVMIPAIAFAVVFALLTVLIIGERLAELRSWAVRRLTGNQSSET